MIKLDVKDYCHTCTEFNADIQYPDKYFAENFVDGLSDTIIRCSEMKKCEKIRMYLEKTITKKE